MDYTIKIDETSTAKLDGTSSVAIINFHIKISGDNPVDLSMLGEDSLAVGFRVINKNDGSILYEGRVPPIPQLVKPRQWFPMSAEIPTDHLKDVDNIVLRIDFLREDQFWLNENMGKQPNLFDVRFLLINPSNVAPNVSQIEESRGLSKSPISKPSEEANESASTMAAEFEKQNLFASPNHRIDTFSRKALSNYFRLKQDIIEQSPTEFLVHCYHALLTRDPEFEVQTRQVEFESVASRIDFLFEIAVSKEFDSDQDCPISNRVARRLAAALGWPTNTLVQYALRLESLHFSNYDQFLKHLKHFVSSNTYSAYDVREIAQTDIASVDVTRFFESLVDLAAEFSIGIARLENITSRLERAGVTIQSERHNLSPYGLSSKFDALNISGESVDPHEHLL